MTFNAIFLFFIASSGLIAGLCNNGRIFVRRLILTAFVGGSVGLALRGIDLSPTLLRLFSWWHWPALISTIVPASIVFCALALVRWGSVSLRTATACAVALCFWFVLVQVAGNDAGADLLVGTIGAATAVSSVVLGFLFGNAVRVRTGNMF